MNYEKYNLSNDNIELLMSIENCCVNGQNEIILNYKNSAFVLEPHGEEIGVYAYGHVLGRYSSFEDLLLNHKINGVPLIELVDELDFGD